MTSHTKSNESSNLGAALAHFIGTKRIGLVSQAGAVFWVSFCGLALIAAIIVSTAVTIKQFRVRELQTAQRELENTVRLLARHFDQQITDFDAVGRSVALSLAQRINSTEEFKSVVSSQEFHDFLHNKVNDTSDFAGVNVYDIDGNWLASSIEWPVSQVNLSDRRYFQTFKKGAESSPVLVELVQSRISQGITVVIARKIYGPSGLFLGMVTRSIQPRSIEAFLSSLSLTDGTIAILHQDGTLLARVPQNEKLLGHHFVDAPLLEEAASNNGFATMEMESPLDGEKRLASLRYLDRYPLSVVATIKVSTVLANWREQLRTVLCGGTGAVAVGLLMLAFIVRYLRQQHQRLDIAVNNMRQGLLLFDRRERLVICNKRYIEMFGLSIDVVKPGRKLREIIQHRKEKGSLLGDVDQHCNFIREGSKTGKPSQTVAETPDGRWMHIINQPLSNGGWVSTLEDITEQRQSEQRITRLALYDSLTELPNRAFFLKHLQRQVESCSARSPVAVLFLDTDEFKSVNDTLGHQIGDELLKSIARALQSCLGPRDFLARLGGDEFAVVVPNCGGPEKLVDLVDRIHAALRQPHQCATHALISDASIGIAVAPGDGITCEELLQNADLAMYEAKSSGRKTYRFFEPGMEKKARDRQQLESELRTAIKNGQIEVHYQPILDLHKDEIVGCEALARWKHPEHGDVSPGDFIPIAEQSGLIDQLGEFVLRAACQEAATWPSNIRIAVNVSPVQFKNSLLPLKVVSALSESGLCPGRLELEITEAVLIADDEAALKTLHELRALGVRVGLDDFGTGYSSLSYLSKFPFDKIKIDRSFVNELTHGSKSAGVVKAVVSLASEHCMSTTAEGVETEQQRNVLQQLNCDEMQGFLLSPAKSGYEIRKMLGCNLSKKLPAC